MVKRSPKVSVLVPICKVEQYIERCVQSLLKQTYVNIEYIFVDDASPDNSISILKDVVARFPDRSNDVRILHHEKNRGLAAARNTALDHASGEYIIIVDSDDMLETHAIETMVDSMLANEADIVVGGYSRFSDDYNRFQGVDSGISENRDSYLNNIILRNSGVHIWGKLIATDILKKNGIRWIEGLNYSEDYDIYPKIVFYSKKIVNLTHLSLYNYFIGNVNSYTSGFLTESAMRNIIDTINDLSGFFIARDRLDLVEHLRVRNKIMLFEYSDPKDFRKIKEIIPEKYKKLDIALKHRVVGILDRFAPLFMLRLYIKCGDMIKRVV